VLNQPLDPHQFDYEGLGPKNGDVVGNSTDSVKHLLKNGKLVKIENTAR